MSRPWMPLYIDDYLGDTGNFRASEHGAYILMIMHYWKRGSLPDDDRQLAAIARMTAAEWRKARPVLAPLFLDGWRHKRIDAELAKAAAISNKRRDAANHRHSNNNANEYANAVQEHTQSTSHSPQRDDDGEARARADEGLSGSAADLAARILADCGFDPDGLMAVSGHYQVQTWLNQGVPPEVIYLACVEAARKAKGKIRSWNYFIDPVATRWAELQAPLPEVKVTHGAKHERPINTQSNSLAEAARKRLAEFDQWEAEQHRPGAGEAGLRGSGPNVRLLSPRGSG